MDIPRGQHLLRLVSWLRGAVAPRVTHPACVLEHLENRRLLHAGHPDGGEPAAPWPPATPADAGAVQLLPDLVPVVNASLGYLHGWVLDAASQPDRVLLRLTVTMANVGAGPLEIRGGQYTDAGNREVFQRLFSDGGGFSDRLAGTFVGHPEHGHIHFEDFAEYRLREVSAGDGVGSVVRSGGKVSFCLLDEARAPYHVEGASADRQYQTCDDTVQGISVGWVDVYERTLPDQWIDVTGVAPGRYWLEVAADPQGRLVEADDSNNEARILIDLDPAGTTLVADRFESNESLGTAADLGTLGNAIEPQLSIHAPGDQDVFRFTAASSGTVTVAVAGASGPGEIDLALFDADGAPLAASAAPGPEDQVTASVAQGRTYYVKVSSTEGATYGSYTLSVQGIAPLVTIAPGTAQTSESPGSAPASFVITRNGPVNALLTVNLAVSGTAINGEDVETVSGSVVIPVRQSSVTVVVRAVDDADPEDAEVLTLTLLEHPGYVADPAAASASVIVGDDDAPQPLPAPWSSADVGPVGSPGTAGILDDGDFHLTSAGGDTARGRRDVLHMASQDLDGDGAVWARVVEWDRTDPTGLAGVTLREGSAAPARAVTLAVSAAGEIRLIVRKSDNARAKVKVLGRAAGEATGVWLRLLRAGRSVTAATSDDGTEWRALTTVRTTLGPRLTAGVVCGGSGDPAHVGAARFEAPLVASAPAAPADLAAVTGPGGVTLTWTDNAANETGYVVERATRSRKRFLPVAELPPGATRYEDLAALAGVRHFYRVRAIAPGGDAAAPSIVSVRLPRVAGPVHRAGA